MKAIHKNWEEDEFQTAVVDGRKVWIGRQGEEIGCEESKLFLAIRAIPLAICSKSRDET